MSWYSSDYRFRRALSVDCTGSASSPRDATIAIAADDAEFWETIASDADDIRVTDADGITLETYDIASFDYANKVLTVEIDNATVTGSSHNVFWLYFGYASAAAGNTPFSPSGAATGYTALEIPDPAYIVAVAPERPGATIPAQKIAKNTSETIFLYWDIEDVLMRRDYSRQQSAVYEEPSSYKFAVTDGGVAQAGMIDETLCRVITANGRRYVRVAVQDGTTATDYIGLLTLKTSLGRILQATCLIQVRLPSEDG